MRWTRWLPMLALFAVNSAARPVCAQPAAARRPFRESVAIPVDSQTVRSIETAREHLAQNQWSEAIPILQQIIETRESTLLAIEPGRYINAADYCHLLISLLPADGLAAYRQRTDPRFRERFERARQRLDEAGLANIVRFAFNCSFTGDALRLLADLEFERGEFAAARQYLELLVPAVPVPSTESDDGHSEERPDLLAGAFLTCRDSGLPEETVLARLVLCSIFEGDIRRARQELRAFALRFPEARGQLAGRNGRLAETLAAELTASSGWSPLPARPATTFGGRPSRNPVPGKSVRPVQILWQRPIPASAWRGPRVRPLLTDERPPALHPLVVDDHIFVSTSDAIFAFDLDTGRPAWATDDSVPAAIYGNSGEGSTRRHLPDTGVPSFTLTTARGRLFARLGAPFLRKSPHETSAISEIVALDISRREGQLDLRLTSDRIDAGSQSPEATTWSFEGAPLIHEGRLFVSLRQGFPEDRSVVGCFDSRTGRLIWQTRVAASLGNLPDHFNLLGTNLLTLDHGRLFLATGTGAIASLDAGTGRLLWVVTYESREPGSLESLSDPRRAPLTPCLSAHGILFAAPPDSDLLFALEASSGRLVWNRQLAERPRHLIGVHNGRLFAAGNSLQAFDVLTGQPAWPQRLAFSNRAGQTFGRPVLTRNEILWPLHDELLYVDQSDGTITGRINLREAFGITGGNLMIHGDRLIITPPDALVVLTAVPGSS